MGNVETVERRLEEIAVFWNSWLSNSLSAGGLRKLSKQAKGCREHEFFKLKIHELSVQKDIDLISPPPPKLAEKKRQSIWHSISCQLQQIVGESKIL